MTPATQAGMANRVPVYFLSDLKGLSFNGTYMVRRAVRNSDANDLPAIVGHRWPSLNGQSAPIPSSVSDYLTLREAARLLGIPYRRFCTFVAQGNGPPKVRLHRTRRAWLVQRDVLIEWARERGWNA